MFVSLPLLALSAVMLSTFGFAVGILSMAMMLWLGLRNTVSGPIGRVRG